jgi:Lon protease-like protein
MSDESAIQVNFGKPMPLFPLNHVTLLPQQVVPFHIFEPRYRQMVDLALDTSGQIALAVFAGDAWKQQYHGRPPLRPVVCLGHIVQHERLEDGRYNILVQGICRARIVRELPASDEVLFRRAILEPVGLEHLSDEDLSSFRTRVEYLFDEGPLSEMAAAEPLLQYVRNSSIPTQALMELVSFAVVSDDELKYRLLAEADERGRAALLLAELEHLGTMIRKAALQRPDLWPKGCSWN